MRSAAAIGDFSVAPNNSDTLLGTLKDRRKSASIFALLQPLKVLLQPIDFIPRNFF